MNLLTCQASHRQPEAKTNQILDFSIPNKTLKETDFKCNGLEESKAYNLFISNVKKYAFERMNFKPIDLKSSLLGSLENAMTNYCSKTPDNIAYGKVDQAKASNLDEVGDYLLQVQKQFKIGQNGHPSKALIAGDQQTYALMQTLIKKNPECYGWVLPYIGDWHLLKNCAETIRDMLWAGGLQHLANQCGYHKDLNRWRDIHKMLVGVHESLWRELCMKYQDTASPLTFEQWCDHIRSDENKDEISRFWLQTLDIIDAYMAFYFSIRSGNWNLRMASLPKIGALIFAYAHFNYEDLICAHIKDVSINYPKCVLDAFKRGEWSVSITGKPFKNVAIDECHEMHTNKNTKINTSRPSIFRTVVLAPFYALANKIVQGVKKVVYMNSSRSKKIKTSNDICQKVLSNFSDVDIFACDSQRPLRDVFDTSDKQLPIQNRTDLLSVTKVGANKMTSYIRQYVFCPPLEVQMKRNRTKLKTFAKKKSTLVSQKSKIARLTKLTKGLTQQAQKSGHYYDKILPFPLALCDEFGEIRDRDKSLFKSHMYKDQHLNSMFSSEIPFAVDENCEVIVDFLMYLHCPPPLTVSTCQEFADHLWKIIVMKSGFDRGFSIVTIISDKVEYLPPMRQIVHQQRSKPAKNSTSATIDTNINNSRKVHHGTSYSKCLSNAVYKANLVMYIMKSFESRASNELSNNQALILDYEGKDPTEINKLFGTKIVRQNNQGEADNNIFWHTNESPCDKILVIASDTDVLMNGLTLLDAGWFATKSLAIQISKSEFVSLNEGVTNINSHPKLVNLAANNLAVLSLYSIYITSGSYYLSNFFKLTSETILNTFLKYSEFISPDDSSFVKIDINNDGAKTAKLSFESYTKLIVLSYLEKHKKLYSHICDSPVKLWDTFQLVQNNFEGELRDLLVWLSYDFTSQNVKVTTLEEFSDFTRRVCYFNCPGSSDVLKLMLPTTSALELHVCRANYCLQILFESCYPFPTSYQKIGRGWIMVDDKCLIEWESQKVQKELEKKRMKPKSVIVKCLCSSVACCGPNSRCKKCTKSCRPCSTKCKCKANCLNPHNNGGDCSKCRNEQGVRNNIADGEQISSEAIVQIEVIEEGEMSHDIEVVEDEDFDNDGGDVDYNEDEEDGSDEEREEDVNEAFLEEVMAIMSEDVLGAGDDLILDDDYNANDNYDYGDICIDI